MRRHITSPLKRLFSRQNVALKSRAFGDGLAGLQVNLRLRDDRGKGTIFAGDIGFQTLKRLPRYSGIETPVSVSPSIAGFMKLVLLSIVVVPTVPSGMFKCAPTAPNA